MSAIFSLNNEFVFNAIVYVFLLFTHKYDYNMSNTNYANADLYLCDVKESLDPKIREMSHC